MTRRFGRNFLKRRSEWIDLQQSVRNGKNELFEEVATSLRRQKIFEKTGSSLLGDIDLIF